MCSVGIERLVGHRIGVVDRNDHGTERDAVEPVGEEKDTRLHVLDREIGAQHLFVERIFPLAQLLGVIPPVPRFENGPLPIGLQQRIHLRELLPGPCERRFPDPFEQFAGRLGRAGHLLGQHVIGIGVVAEQAGFFEPQADEIVDDLLVVVRIVVVAARNIGFIELLAQFAFGRVGQKRNAAWAVERDRVFVLQSQLQGFLAGRVAHIVGEAAELATAHGQHERIGLGQHIAAEADLQER